MTINTLFHFTRLDEVKALVEKGCPIDKRNEHGNTPLHMACQNGKGTMGLFLIVYFSVSQTAIVANTNVTIYC